MGRLAKMCSLMTTFGMILGAIAGFLVAWTILITDMGMSVDEILNEIVEITFLSALYGSMFGGIYGGVSGLISGFFMALVTAVAFRELRNVRRFRIVMGSITAVLTTGVFLLGGLWELGIGLDFTWTVALIMSVVIAVYASQIVSKRYARDSILRKKKIEA